MLLSFANCCLLSLQAWCVCAHLQTGIHMRKDFTDSLQSQPFCAVCGVFFFGSYKWELFLKVCPQHDY